MEKSKTVITSIIVFVSVIGAIIIFKPVHLIMGFFSDINENKISIANLKLVNLYVVVLLSTVSGFIGFFLSKNKKRNKLLWTVLSVLFNFWAIIALLLLPKSDIARPGAS